MLPSSRLPGSFRRLRRLELLHSGLIQCIHFWAHILILSRWLVSTTFWILCFFKLSVSFVVFCVISMNASKQSPTWKFQTPKASRTSTQWLDSVHSFLSTYLDSYFLFIFFKNHRGRQRRGRRRRRAENFFYELSLGKKYPVRVIPSLR